MGFIKEAKRIRELSQQLKRVKGEMAELGKNGGGVKDRARKFGELAHKLRGVQDDMREWELGELASEADKEGKELDKLITLAEARERVALAKIKVSEAKDRLHPKPKIKTEKPKSLKRKPSVRGKLLKRVGKKVLKKAWKEIKKEKKRWKPVSDTTKVKPKSRVISRKVKRISPKVPKLR